MGRVRRVFVILLAAGLAVTLATLALVHTPWARNRALAWATGFVTRYDLVLQAGDLGYNAMTRRVTLTDVRLAADGHQARPFLTARRIDVQLPWIVYRGRFAIDHLTIAGGRVDIYRDADGVVNLPPGSDAPTPARARRLDLDGLTLDGLDVQYVDAARDWGVTIPGIAAELADTALGATGAFAVRQPLAVRLRDRTLTLAPFDTVMTFDGADVALEQLRLQSPELNAFLSGSIARVLDSPQIDLALAGTVNLDEAMAWVPPPPVPVSGLATIEGTIRGPAGAIVTDLAVSSRTLTVGRERELQVSGPVRVTFEAFSGEDLVIRPVSGGEIRAAFAVPWGGDAVSTARAAWTGLDSQAALAMAAVEPQAMAAAFAGSGEFSFGEPRRFTITNRSTGRTRRGAVPMTGTITASIVGDDYSYDHDHAFPGFTIEGRMAGRIHPDTALASTMTGPAHARVSDVAEAAASAETLGFPVAAIMHDVGGAVDAPMMLGGTYRDPEIQTTLTGDAVVMPLLGTVAASAQVDAGPAEARITAIDLRRGRSAITGDVTADLVARTWDGTLRVTSPDAEELQGDVPEAWRVSGPLAAAARLGGSLDDYRLDATITGQDLLWAGQPIDRVSATAVVTAEAIDVSSLQLFQGAGFMDGRVRYAWESGAYDARLTGDRLTWQGTLLTPNDAQALFSVRFEGAGIVAQPKGVASLDFALSGGDAGTLIGAGTATAELLGDQARVVARLPSIGARINADIATASPYDYKLAAELDRFELQKLSPFIGAIDTEVLGFATGTVTASGRLADDRDRVAFVSITALDAGIGGVPVTLNAPLHATLRGDELALKDLDARVGSGRLGASGEWTTSLAGTFRAQFIGDFQDAIRLGRAFGVPPAFDGTGPFTFDLTSNGRRAGTTATVAITNGTFSWGGGHHAVQALTLDAALAGEDLTITTFTGNVATGGVIGAFSATGAAIVPELTLAAVNGELVLDAARFTFSGIPVAQQRPSRLEFANGTLSVADATWLVAEHPLAIGGTAGFAAEDPPLDLSVKGLVDLRILSALVSTMAFDGTANIDALIAGSAARPLLDGRIVLDDAEIIVAEPRLVLSELNGPIELDGEVAVFDGVRGLANGGALVLDGTIEFAGLALSGGALNIQTQGVALEMPEGLRSEIDALVTYRPDPRNPSLTGDIRVVQGAYTEAITLAALARQAAMPVTPVNVERPYLDRLQLNLAITTTEDVTVDNNYGRLAAGAGVRLVGTVGQPGMDGRITLREGGQIYLAGRTFRITRGDISFTDRRRIQPEFNVTAEARLPGSGTVTMSLTGTLERPTVDLSSEEGSRTPGEIAAELMGSANTETALTLLSADLLGVTGRAIGLDAFRVERGDFEDADFYQSDPALISANRTDPTTRLTVGKRLSDQVEFTVSQNLRESGKATFVVSYYPRYNVELRAVSRDSGEISVGARHQITFGGGRSRPPSERRVRPTVSAVTFIDVDPAIEAEARAKIGLDPGDEFDFLDLQRDVDRIRDMFQAQGYFEARVRTRRIEADDARSVVVEYRVERGPRTTLEIHGYEAPSGLVKELELAWHRNVFDQFLIEDLTGRVRRHLVTTGELASIVVGQVERPSPEVKRLRIDVTPGIPVSGRHIRYTGNRRIEAGRLTAEVAAAGLEVEAWLNRSVVERLLRQVYNEEGFLRAEVTGRPLDMDGTTGVLTFDIVEGPRAQVTAVTWAGAGEAQLPALIEAAALPTPAPYVIAGVTAARNRIEQHYRRLGFNAAEVEVQPAVSPADEVTLNVVVIEGPQQVLQEVTLAGQEVTRGWVITEALNFELGAPVNLDAWALARKRLYDTNVFRIVDIQPVPLGEAAGGVQPVRAVVTVEEYPEWSFRYGVQMESERSLEIDEFTSTRNAGIVSELRNPNLFGRALTLGLFGMYQYDRRDATVFLATSRLFGWRARSSVYGFVSRDRIRDELGDEIVAITDVEGVSADQRWRRGAWQVVYGYRFERNRTYDPDPGGDPFPLDFVVNLAKLSTAALLDRRDDPINAKRGTFSSISFEQSSAWFGSDVNNRKLLTQQYLFLPLGPLVLASRVQAGMAFGVDDLLPSDRFRAGGASTVRGYGEDSLGPRDSLGVPSGGDKLIVVNQEVRVPVYRWAHAVGFIDAGNVFAKHQSFDWGELKVGYGAGLRLDTPVGLLRADVGFPRSLLPTSRSTTRKPRWYFGFGHIF